MSKILIWKGLMIGSILLFAGTSVALESSQLIYKNKSPRFEMKLSEHLCRNEKNQTALDQDDSGVEWDKLFGGSMEDVGNNVRQTTDGGYIITGYTNHTKINTGDIWLIKTDAHGLGQWNKTYGGEHGDFGFSVQQTTDGGYIITGDVDVYFDMIFFSRIGLIKTYPDGNIVWSKNYGIGKFSMGRAVLQTHDNGYIILGNTNFYKHNVIMMVSIQ